MSREIFSRVTDSVKSKLLPQRGLKASLKREVKSCFEYFDRTGGGPISSLHANGVTLEKLSDGSGYAIEIQEYRVPGGGDTSRFTYKDRITIRGKNVTMRRIGPVETSVRQSIPRKEVETVIYMIQHVTVPYETYVEDRIKRRAQAENLLVKARGRLPTRRAQA